MPQELPSQVSEHVSGFDRMAEAVSSFVARAPYFFGCLLSVVAWALSGPVFHFNDTWLWIINTATTILVFLMVALLQNSQKRTDKATQHKLNAIAQALAQTMQEEEARRELCRAVGLEQRESSTED